MTYLWIAAILLIALGWRVLGGAASARGDRPAAGEVIYSDTGMWEEVSEPLFSRATAWSGGPTPVRTEERGHRLSCRSRLRAGACRSSPSKAMSCS